jgi:RNA polymerase sigma factor (sigma-70 family)
MHKDEIIASLKRGDNAAFRAVVGMHQKLVFNCAFKFLKNKEAAEDLTQEVFVEVYQSIHSFRGDAQLSTWIYRIAVTKCLNEIKHQQRRKRFALLVSLFGDDGTERRVPAAESSNPELELEKKERAEILNKALSRLPDYQRTAYTLSKVEGMSYDEIAKVMNTSLTSVESLIHRAKNNLVKHLTLYYKSHLP